MDEQDDPKDRLIDTLLREALGREAPPNLAGRILQRVDRDRRRFYWIAGALSTAAAIALAVAVWRFAVPAPQPEIVNAPEKPKEPDLQWVGPPNTPPKPERDLKPSLDEWARGDRIKTDDAARKLELGGYCKLEAAPHTSLVNEGKDKAEQVLLEAGSVVCQVDKHIGTFAVRTDSGTVKVTGTKFSVGITGDGNDLNTEHAKRRIVAVSVDEGSVELAGWGTGLHAGEKGGIDFGVVVKSDENAIEIRSEGLPEPRRYTARVHDGSFDKSMQEAFRKLTYGSRVQLAWVQQERPRATKLQVVWARPESEHHRGTVTGVITEKEGGQWIRVKSDTENERYTPRWIENKEHHNDGKLDPEMVRALEKLNVGDKVRIEWVLDERRRIVKIDKQE